MQACFAFKTILSLLVTYVYCVLQLYQLIQPEKNIFVLQNDVLYDLSYIYSRYATTNECYNEQFFINKIRMPQRRRRNTIGRRSTRVRMTCRSFPFRLVCQSSYLLSFVRFTYQIISLICLFAPLAVRMFFFLVILLYNFNNEPVKQSEKAN